VSADDVRALLGGSWLNATPSGAACQIGGDAAQGNGALVSVAVVEEDVLTSVRARYPDGSDVEFENGMGFWSPSVETLWVLVPGPRTAIVSILGTTLTGEELQATARGLAATAIGRL
jgi:hypothetical protein